ncbi:MAG: thioredoxin family protein, partial [Candidatus Sumerlaeia bacterium]|nr:thioredoxin family protein [Candidatus Sumerlaeia bacterium]
VWGGVTTAKNTSVNALVYSAPVLADGTIGQWRNEQFSLPKPFYSAACTSSGPYLLSFCPRYAGGIESNDIWFAEITDRGISPWQKLPTDLKTRLYLGVATDFRRGVIFLPGGRITYSVKKSLDETVYVFRLTKKATEPPDARFVQTITIPDEASNLPHLSYLYLREKPKDAFAEFLPYEIGREKSLQSKLPLIAYFHSPTARPCETQRQVLQQFNFSNYKDKLIFTWIDTTLFPQLVQQMGVFRVPCWIYFDSSGNEIKRKVGIIDEGELQNWLFGG